jgi:undecaprenyl-diphosphatase
MHTFQVFIYAVVHGVSEFLPISSQAHDALLGYLLGWQAPSGSLMTAFLMGSSLALFVYFRHDWASMISSVLQVVIYRKKPMTLDERIPLFVGLTTLPAVAASVYFGPTISTMEWTPWQLCGLLGGAAIPLWFFDYWGRKIKGLYDWNLLDALIVGLTQATALVPGWDHLSGLLLGGFLLNYKREPGLKYAYFALFPLTFARAVVGFHQLDFHAFHTASVPLPQASPIPMVSGVPLSSAVVSSIASSSPELTWLSFMVGLVVSFLVGLLVIGYSMRQVHSRGFRRPMLWRIFVALGVFGYLWFHGA